jgi:hypothetical protein
MELLNTQSPLAVSLMGPDILLRTLFSKSLSLCSSRKVTDQVWHPHKITGEIMVLYNLIFMVLDRRRESKKKDSEVYSSNSILKSKNVVLSIIVASIPGI